MSRKYRNAYSTLGEERVEIFPRNLNKSKGSSPGGVPHESEFDFYWNPRKDEHWVAVPAIRRYIRRTRTLRYITTLPKILINLQPATTFNPYEVWEKELERERRGALLASGQVDTNEEKPKPGKLSKADEIKRKNIENQSQDAIVREITKIRNTPKSDLISIIKEVKIDLGRAALFIQILHNAYNGLQHGTGSSMKDAKDHKKVLFECVWAIEALGELPKENTPPPKNIKTDILPRAKNSWGLVYDNFKDVAPLIESAREVMAKEKDLIKLQLTEMSDTLPPLSKFSTGFRLDPWQKRVLRWIDAGRSVVICAPTSSGKTVLSSYVALIFKSEAQRTDRETKKNLMIEAEENEKKKPQQKNGDSDDSDGEPEDGVAYAVEDGNSDDDDYEDFEVDLHGENVVSDVIDLAESAKAVPESITKEEDYRDRLHSAMKDSYNLREYLGDFDKKIIIEDWKKRNYFGEQRNVLNEEEYRVLFVVPTEPLVWQVAAYFTKLLMEVGELETKVAVITDQLMFNPTKRFGMVPQIVVGTPGALESAITKCRGIVGREETSNPAKVQGNTIPGGFDHFDWVIYDEVHSLDGSEGDALQRLIRSMNCKFLALSATVGNAEQLRGWMERVRGDQLFGVEAMSVDINGNEIRPEAVKLENITLEDNYNSACVAEIEFIQTTTLQNESLHLTADEIGSMTVLDAKIKLDKLWPSSEPAPEHAKCPMQLIFEGIDMKDDNATLKSYGVFGKIGEDGNILQMPSVAEKCKATIQVHTIVNILQHSSRFINLQRYIWHGKKGDLSPVSPLAAIQDVPSLQKGILGNSSLSFTSKDSYRLYEEMSKIYPSHYIEHISPYTFFGKTERITLQRTKDYEDALKLGLKDLAIKYPLETQELLNRFQLEDQEDKKFDLCDLCLHLKEQDMLPCLPFHLSTFEAVRLFNQLLAGIESRQKIKYPTFHLDKQAEIDERKAKQAQQIDALGGNNNALQDAIRSGDLEQASFTVDEYEPHPNFVFTKGLPITDLELIEICDEMERYDGFTQRSKEELKYRKGKNLEIVEHALIRGLRRGIGLFINEVSFPSYRRAVQRLASKGKLGVVISDDSLAFGVNMPFRTCVFCGEMYDMLDELMAQQMSGRAGRRGLDTQGNLIFCGLRASYIRKIMIGKITDITGEEHDPRYPTMFLQSILSPRYVGWARSKCIGGRTLLEHCQLANSKNPEEDLKAIIKHTDYTFDVSKECMSKLGFISFDGNTYLPNSENQISYATLAVIWSLRSRVWESVSIGLVMADIIEFFSPMTSQFSYIEKKQNTERLEPYVFDFLTIMAIFCCRKAYDPQDPKAIKFTDVSHVNKNGMQLYSEWTERFSAMQDRIPDAFAALRDPVVPGTELDGRLLQCMLDRNYIHNLSFNVQQEVKTQIWHLGNVMKSIHNCCWPEVDHEQLLYHGVSYFIFRQAFLKLRYLNGELIRKVINFDDVSAAKVEKRVDEKKPLAERQEWIPREAHPWGDNNSYEPHMNAPVAYTTAISRAAEIYKDQLERVAAHLEPSEEVKQKAIKKAIKAIEEPSKKSSKKAAPSEKDIEDAKKQAVNKLEEKFKEEALQRLTQSYETMGTGDSALVELLAKPSSSTVTLITDLNNVLRKATWCKTPAEQIGMLIWLCTRHCPAWKPNFQRYLQIHSSHYGKGYTLTDEDICGWYTMDTKEILTKVPSSEPPVTEKEVDELKSSVTEFIEWLQASDDDDDDDDENDEEDD